jgi:hypothetical protein
MSSAKIKAMSSNRPFSRSDRQRLFSGAVSSVLGDGVIEGRGRLGRRGEGETGGWGDWEMGRMGGDWKMGIWGRLKDHQEYFTMGGLALIVKNYWDCQCR